MQFNIAAVKVVPSTMLVSKQWPGERGLSSQNLLTGRH